MGNASAEPPAWPLQIRVDLAGVAPSDKAGVAERALRARPGVAVFVSLRPDEPGEGPRALSVSACGDLRAFVAGRLRGEGPRPDLSEVTTGIEACESGSGFEADLACDAVARVRTPEAAALMASQRSAVFVHLDPGHTAPACRVIDDASSLEGLDPGTIIGPFGARSHAEAWSAMLDARFELCRKPATLALRPNAEACSYKDMGLCPAPCDGSEPMDDYRGRVREALAFDGDRLACERARSLELIAEAAAGMDFEQAGVLRAAHDALESARCPGVEWITTMNRFGALAVMPSGKAGWVRIIVHRGGISRVLGDLRVRRGDELDSRVETVIAMVDRAASGGVGARFSELAGDGAGLIATHLRSSRRTSGRFVRIDWGVWGQGEGPLDRGIDCADLGSAIRRAARLSRAGSDAAPGAGRNEDIAHHEG